MPQYLMSARSESITSVQLQPDAAEEVGHVAQSVAAAFDDLDLVTQAFDPIAVRPIDEVVGDDLHSFSDRPDEFVEAVQAAFFDLRNPLSRLACTKSLLCRVSKILVSFSRKAYALRKVGEHSNSRSSTCCSSLVRSSDLRRKAYGTPLKLLNSLLESSSFISLLRRPSSAAR